MSFTRVACAVLAALVLSAPAVGQDLDSAVAAPSDLVLILDASGSMWGQIEGENKIVIARRVLADLIDGLPESGGDVALVAYGHRREGDCDDIETVAPLGPLDRGALKGKVEALNPKGKTPITASLEEAFELMTGRQSGATVILVSDGLETCGGDPCAATRAAKEAGLNFVMHVVGFDVAKEDVSSLECSAQAGGGLFLSAENAAGLAGALETAVERSVEAIPDGRLAVKVTADGKLHDASIWVTDLATGEGAGGGRTYYSEETNPRLVPLSDGRFAVRVDAVGLEGDVRRDFEIEIVDGSRVDKEFDFSSGELSISVLRNGELSDATYNVRVAGTTESAAGGRTYTRAPHNPAKVRLTAGTYDVEVRSVELAGDHRASFSSVVVPPQEAVAVAHEWTSGELRVTAVADGALADATVTVRTADGKPVGAGRTYTSESSNPKTFIVVPGEYEIVAQKIRGSRQELSVTVRAGETTDATIDFSDGGPEGP